MGIAAASGDATGALRYFTAANFPGEKQDDAVREAYLEVRLQRLLAAASARQCAGIAEQDTIITVPVIDDRAHLIGADDEHLLIRAGLNKLRSDDKCV